MKFEVNKFLALTAMLAGASAVAAGCSSTDAKPAPGESGGEAGEGPTPSAGSGNTTSEAGAAGVAEAQGGAAGATTAEGGTSEGGEAGAPVVGSCISDLVGAGGAADETSSPCDLLGAAGAPDCGDENGNYVAQGCNALYGSGLYRPSVILAYNECATALPDSCDASGVIDCATGLIGKGCTEETTSAACTFVASKCPGVNATLCAGILDLATPEGQDLIQGCMDPANELYYNPWTTAPNLDCDVNLKHCANLPVPAQR
ncbi:MAG: hypothetical protein ABUL62_26755 [Myxococcales bacterium]